MIRAGCKKGKGSTAEALLEAEEAVLEEAETEADAAAEELADPSEDDAAEDAADENGFDSAWETEIAGEKEADGIVLTGGASFAASIILNVSTVFDVIPFVFAKSVSALLCEVIIARTVNISVGMISRSLFLMKYVFV